MYQPVRDLMTNAVVTCPPNTTVGQAARLLARHRLHALVVADITGEPHGILSDVDLLAGEWLSGDAASLETMRRMTVAELMSAPVATIDADAPASEAAARMEAERIHRLVVTELDRPVGVISVSDLVAGLARAAVRRGTVAAVMSRGIVVCLDDTPVGAVARAMTERRSRSVVVVDAQGRPLGIVTGFDLLPVFTSGEVGRPVSDIMHRPITIHPDNTLREAADLMLQHHIHRLLVVDPARPDGMPLGLIATSDIVAEMAAPGSIWQ